MCGICGLRNLDGRPLGDEDRRLVEEMSRRIVHRGPDDEGAWSSGDTAVAMRRLSIIDVAGGRQPVWNEDRTVCVTNNGEIYNYLDLRRDLEARGHRFATRSDTEVLVHLYEEEGVDFLPRLNGMFALSLYDARRRRLLLARDRYGIKPLVYTRRPGRIQWASEIRALLADPTIDRTIDAEALSTYLSFYYVFAPRTIFRSVRRLPPGGALVADGSGIRILKWWSPPAGESAADEAEAAAELPRRLREAVRRHLQSEVPLGVFLSGGIDSTSLVALASDLTGEPVRTFSIGFAEASYSELADARSVAGRYRTRHREYLLRPEQVPPAVERFASNVAEPYGDWSFVVNDEVARRAKEHVTVILRGDGGDEVMGGYPTYAAARLAALYRLLPEAVRRGLVEPAVARLPASGRKMGLDVKARAFLRGAESPPVLAHMRFKEIFDDDEKAALIADPDLRAAATGFEPFAEAAAFAEGPTLERSLMALDLRTFLEGNGFAIGDLTSMAHAVEARVPYLDNDFFDYAWRLPAQYFVRGLTTKALFRRAMAPYLPRDVVRGKKRGFVIPTAPWLRAPGNPVAAFVAGVLAPDRLRAAGLLDPGTADRYLEEHVTGRADRSRQITALVSLTLWAERHLA